MNPGATAAPAARLYLCDFDGTVAREDVGNRFFGRFTRDRALWERVIEDWREGRAGGREVLARECALLDVDRAEAERFLEGFGVDAGFAGFRSAALARGDRVAIASDGLLFYIRRILDRFELTDVPAYANDARFAGTAVVPVFGSPEGEGCGRCGTCKAAVLARLVRDRAPGTRAPLSVFVGDGLSDRCAARVADVVYAKGDLLRFCESEGIAARPFVTFADVARGEGLEPSPAAVPTGAPMGVPSGDA